ncbi:hypothetical protein D9M68_566840 [compost metagenome]
MGEGVEEAGDERGRGVAQQAAAQALRGDLGLGQLAEGEEHAGGLDEDDQHHQAHGEHRGEVEFRHAEVQRGDHVEQRPLLEAGQVDHAQAGGDGIAQGHADQHRDVDPEALQEAVDQQDRQQHCRRQDQVDRRAEVRRLLAAAGPVDRHREQAHADRGDHRAGHQWREEAHDAAHERRDEHAEQAGGDGRAEDAGNADAGHAGHRHHAADRGEAGAHHHRHADADRADAERLDDGGDAGDQQVGVDQEGDFLARQAGGLADDQRHSDGAAVHQQHVLETHQQQLQEGETLIDRRDGSGGGAAGGCLGHESPRFVVFVGSLVIGKDQAAVVHRRPARRVGGVIRVSCVTYKRFLYTIL